ncbi:POK9 protein, partial [Mystacornis crossleyi]|nr:POK9 protein [Mystacornis crossleyi]
GGSAGVDLATTISITLHDTKVQVVPSMTAGPLGHGLSALLLGRSSTSRQGIFLLSRVIDADYKGNIGIMVQALATPVHIPAQTKIAQLVSFKACVPQAELCERDDGAFGFTGRPQVMLTVPVGNQHPDQHLRICGPDGETVVATELIDTGADITILS